MTDISTKKTIEVWDGESGLNFIIAPDAGGFGDVSICRRNGDGFTCMSIPVAMSGRIVRAITEVAVNIAENETDDDAEG